MAITEAWTKNGLSFDFSACSYVENNYRAGKLLQIGLIYVDAMVFVKDVKNDISQNLL